MRLPSPSVWATSVTASAKYGAPTTVSLPTPMGIVTKSKSAPAPTGGGDSAGACADAIEAVITAAATVPHRPIIEPSSTYGEPVGARHAVLTEYHVRLHPLTVAIGIRQQPEIDQDVARHV